MYGLGQVRDPATPAQRQRQEFITAQLRAINAAIRQALDRGDVTAVGRLREVATVLRRESERIAAAIRSQAEMQQRAAESGALASPLERFAGTLKRVGVGALIALALVAALALRGRTGSW